jgi:hypothetical protein
MLPQASSVRNKFPHLKIGPLPLQRALPRKKILSSFIFNQQGKVAGIVTNHRATEDKIRNLKAKTLAEV